MPSVCYLAFSPQCFEAPYAQYAFASGTSLFSVSCFVPWSFFCPAHRITSGAILGPLNPKLRYMDPETLNPELRYMEPQTLNPEP
jgi:hypothetical protein